MDDHQTTNARFLVDAGGGWLLPQTELQPEALAQMLQGLDRAELLRRAEAAWQQRQTEATAQVVLACEELMR